MAVVEIFNGELAPNTAGPWVAVPESNNYIFVGYDSTFIQHSLDGSRPFYVGLNPKLISPTTPAAPSAEARQMVGFPVKYMRAYNHTGSTITFNIQVSG